MLKLHIYDSPVPDLASMTNKIALLLFTAIISGRPTLEPPSLLAIQLRLLSLFTMEYS